MPDEEQSAAEADAKPVAAEEPQPESQEEPQQSDGSQSSGSAARRRQQYKQALQRARDTAAAETARADAAEARLAKLAPRQAPTEKDFPNYEDLTAAKAGYYAVEALEDRERADVKATAETAKTEAAKAKDAERAALAAIWKEQVADAQTRYADFEAVAYSADIPEGVADIILRSDHGADVAYHLGKNPAEAARIARMTPVEAALAIGRIEGSLTAPKPRNETNAPPPITPVGGRAAPSQKSTAAMTYQEFVRHREAGGTVNR